MDLRRGEVWGKLGEQGGEETVFGMYYIREEFIFKKKTNAINKELRTHSIPSLRLVLSSLCVA